MVAGLNGDFVRLAFPLRSGAFTSLVDSPQEVAQLDELVRLTSGACDDAQAYIDRPFLAPWPSRFSDGTYGVLYGADSLTTAFRESAYHLQRFYSDGNAPAMETRRVRLRLRLRGRADDVRRTVDPKVPAAIYDPDDYGASQRFGAAARDRADAIHYDSVRQPDGGRCAAVFSRKIVRKAEITGLAGLVWDGKRFVEAFTIDTIS